MRRLPSEYRVALVTGAERGLGRQLTLDLLSEGLGVAAIDQCSDRLATLHDEDSSLRGCLGLGAGQRGQRGGTGVSARELERQLARSTC